MYKPITNKIVRLYLLTKYKKYYPTAFFVSECNKVAYVEIYKSCSSSILKALFPEVSSNDARQLHEYANKRAIYDPKSIDNRHYKFCFVRNPFDRLVSCYIDKIENSVKKTGRNYFYRPGYRLLLFFFGVTIKKDMSFDDFVRFVVKVPDFLVDGHFKSQYSIIKDHNVNYIGKYENLGTDWAKLAGAHDLGPLPHINQTSKKKLTKFYLSKDILDMAYEYYKDDVRFFDYEEDYNKLTADLEQV